MPAIDPTILKVLEAVPYRLSVEDGAEAARAVYRALPRRPILPEVRSADRVVERPGGTELPIRIYWPPTHSDDLPAPVVMFFHGGGFVIGDLDTYDGTARQHAVGADAVVVAVDYRLAPEHPYPAAIDDAWAATRWVVAHAEELGVDPARMAVAGDSAGGNLSAAVTHVARADGPGLVFQLLWYPSVMWDPALPSFTENAQAPILDTTTIGTLTRWYAGHMDLSDPPATLVPGRAADLTGLPSAYIAVAGHDPLRDDGIAYAERLSAAGVSVTVDRDDTLIHGYLGYAGVVPAATAAMERGLAALRAALYD